MPLMSSGVIEIECPCCQTGLKIDPATGIILEHQPVKKPVAIEDLHTAVAQLKTDAQKREEAFEKSFAVQKSSAETMDRKFDELLKHAKQGDLEAPPKRPFDLD